MVATNGITSATKPDGKRRHRGFSVSSTSSVFQESADQRYRVTESYPQGGTGIPAGEINYIYYDSQWQAIETRTNGTAASNVSSQMVWSAAYINAAILQDSYIAGVIQPNSRIYFLQDANWNTTAIVNFINAAWQVLQYYVYSPYGTITVLNENGAGSTPIVNNLYQGMTLDPVTGLYYARNRNYSPTLGRWVNQDPAGYINGANTYQFVMSNPVNGLDPMGLCDCNILNKQLQQIRDQEDKFTTIIYFLQSGLGWGSPAQNAEMQWNIYTYEALMKADEYDAQQIKQAMQLAGCPSGSYNDGKNKVPVQGWENLAELIDAGSEIGYWTLFLLLTPK